MDHVRTRWALQNSPELCVLTPLSSPLAPYMLAGVTVTTREPCNRLAFAVKVIEGPNVEHIPIYFCVSSVHRKFNERNNYIASKKRKRTFRELKSCLKPFHIDVQDLLEHPPKNKTVRFLIFVLLLWFLGREVSLVSIL
ncbi:hypothetical protein OESDEN_06470 [Oesophagostomum dentatum]|uniref:Uncharacterized protein n=1 Tax=Oesophagostomum dentatum TaxID=61180 RepID=A0A0B1TBY5_OESDE|nr:hypothetical protein OESDEN_06470 [Oesophagostomum dentatum]